MMYFNLTTNEKGNSFYKKWLKETKIGILLYAPLFLLVSLGIGLMNFGLDLKFILISIYPVLLVLVAFIRPYYSRKKYINQMAKDIELKGNTISIKTWKWFSVNQIIESILVGDIVINEITDIALFKGKKVYLLKKVNDVDTAAFYIVDEFFDNLDVLFSSIGKK